MSNNNLTKAKAAKNDEFYTQYEDIESEMNAYLEYDPDLFRGKTVLCPCDDPDFSNFTRYFAAKFESLGLKKLISTSYARDSKPYKAGTQISMFELNSPNYDEAKTNTHGKIFVLEHDEDGSGNIDIDDLRWEYLDGDGDFRSEEVKALRDEADFIITNPPFSLFREFLAWITEGGKKFAIIGNMNAITYKEVFPLIKDNGIWLGCSIHSGDRAFNVPDTYELSAAGCGFDEKGRKFIRVKGVRWFTNIEHGRRHQPMLLMTEKDNIKYSKHKQVKGIGYLRYDNYDAIEVPFSDAIPKDYPGVMGVPISWLDKYCPEQFEIADLNPHFFSIVTKGLPKPDQLHLKNAGLKDPYARVLIRYTDSWKASHPDIFNTTESED